MSGVARGLRRARRRRRRLLRRPSSRATRARSAPASRSRCRPGTVRLAAQAKGAGMISPRYATMFCFVQTDAALDADDARPAHRRVREALVRPHLGGRPALDQRHGLRARERRVGRARSSRETPDELALGEAMDALLRQLALEIVADGEGARRVGRIVVQRRPGGGRAGGALGGELAARQDRAARRRPQLRPHPPGRRPGVAAGRAVRRRPRDRGPPAGVGRRRDRLEPTSSAELGRRATRWSTCSRCRARAARRRSSSATCRPGIRDLQRGVHVMRDVADPSRGAALHPGVPRPDGGDQVRRRRDDRRRR